MAENTPNLQNVFLNRARRDKTPVTIHVINGYQFNHLTITGYDSFVVTARTADGCEILIYKHAISTVTPESENVQQQKEKKDETTDEQ